MVHYADHLTAFVSNIKFAQCGVLEVEVTSILCIMG